MTAQLATCVFQQNVKDAYLYNLVTLKRHCSMALPLLLEKRGARAFRSHSGYWCSFFRRNGSDNANYGRRITFPGKAIP